ncbi:MAG: CPBP family glutamic-type intramembrane protease [Nitrososphaerales archaeon]|nr:CPBP family glutamic-type intramembrane protease [Nitrososphaerales archaeon]
MIATTGEQRLSSFGKVLVGVFVLLLLVTAALVIISFPVGFYTIFYTSLSNQVNAASLVNGIFFFVGPYVTALPIGGSLGNIFVALSVIYAGMLILAAKQGAGLLSSLRASFSEGFGALFRNTFYVSLVAIGFLAFTILVIDSLETAGSVPVGSLSGDAMQLLMSLTIAPLREELGFRMLTIGLVAALVSLGKSKAVALRAIWRPSAAYEGEVNSTLPRVALAVAVVLSSVAFGLVHIESGSGWQIGKLPEAAIAGLVLGYLYVKYGFHVAVLTHWGIDYLDSVFAFFGQGAFGIPWTSDNGFVLQQVVALHTVAFFGVASFLVVCYLALRRAFADRPNPTAL